MKTRSSTLACALSLLLAGAGTAAAGNPAGRDAESFKEGQLSALYMMDPSLHMATIDADLVGDTMHLRGNVVSESDRLLAERLAGAIPGVARVDNSLAVRPSATSAVPAVSFRQHVEDATAEHQVRVGLERAGYDHQVSVTANGGIVTLAGSVETEAARVRAEQIAQQLPSVHSVVNRLNVDAQGQVAVASDGDGRIDDRWIEERTWSALDAASGLDGERIQVQSERGRIELSGTVDSDAERAWAIEVSKHIRGVTDVDAAQLVVEADEDEMIE